MGCTGPVTFNAVYALLDLTNSSRRVAIDVSVPQAVPSSPVRVIPQIFQSDDHLLTDRLPNIGRRVEQGPRALCGSARFQLPDSPSSDHNSTIARSKLPLSRSLFGELRRPVQDDRHRNGFRLL